MCAYVCIYIYVIFSGLDNVLVLSVFRYDYRKPLFLSWSVTVPEGLRPMVYEICTFSRTPRPPSSCQGLLFSFSKGWCRWNPIRQRYEAVPSRENVSSRVTLAVRKMQSRTTTRCIHSHQTAKRKIWRWKCWQRGRARKLHLVHREV